MRIGSLLGTRRTLAATVALTATAAMALGLSRDSFAQGYQNPRPVQALYNAPAGATNGGTQSSYTDAYGNPLIVPAGFCQGGDCGGCGCNGGCYGPGQCCGCQGGFNGPMPMGAGGTDPPIGYDLMNDVGVQGDLEDQRGPHYWDIRAEAVYLFRDDTFNQNIDFTSLNVGNTIVLNSQDLDYDAQPGFRLLGRYDICPLSVVEFGYTGIFGWEDSKSVSDPTNNLYSLFSRPSPGTGLFGTDPAGVNLPGGPLPQSERASRHTIQANSDLQTAEITYRRYWLGYHPRISGTLLGGFRYTKLDDDFEFRTVGSTAAAPAALTYSEKADNNLAGFQTGADMWISLTQGLRIGTEGKVGIYNNHAKLTNRITTIPTNTTPPTLLEEFRDDNVAFLTEGSVDLVADILPSLSLRVGYEVLFMDSLVLAGENFNQTSPYGNQGPRLPVFNDDGELFYHGGHVGIEYVW